MVNDKNTSSQVPYQKNDADVTTSTGNDKESSSHNQLDEQLSSENLNPVKIIDSSSEESIVNITIERSRSFSAPNDAIADNSPTSSFSSSKPLLFNATGMNESTNVSEHNRSSLKEKREVNFVGLIRPTDSGLSMTSSKESDHSDESEKRSLSPWEEAVVGYNQINSSSSNESIVSINREGEEDLYVTQVPAMRIQESQSDNNGSIRSLHSSQSSTSTEDPSKILEECLSIKSSIETQDSDIISVHKPADPYVIQSLSDESSKFLSFDDTESTGRTLSPWEGTAVDIGQVGDMSQNPMSALQESIAGSSERPLSPWLLSDVNRSNDVTFEENFVNVNLPSSGNNDQTLQEDEIRHRPSTSITTQNLRLVGTESATFYDAVSIYNNTSTNGESNSFQDESVSHTIGQMPESTSKHKVPFQVETIEPSQQGNVSISKDLVSDSIQKRDLIEKNRIFHDYYVEKSALPDGPKYFAPPNSPLSLPVTQKTQAVSSTLETETSNSSRVPSYGSYQESDELITPYQNQMLMETSATGTEPKAQFNQLLLIRVGAFGVFGGIFASSYAQLSCRFAISSLSVGFYQSELKTYAGLWKYSSMTNTFSDYSSCTLYGGRNSIDPPSASRDFGIVAFITGIVSLSILWRFLLFAKTSPVMWRIGVKVAAAAGMAQILTLTFFVEGYCRQNKCQMGSGSVFTIFAAISWFIIAYIMHHNAPLIESFEFKKRRSLMRKISDFFEVTFILERFGLLKTLKEESHATNKDSGLVSTSPPPRYTVMV